MHWDSAAVENSRTSKDRLTSRRAECSCHATRPFVRPSPLAASPVAPSTPTAPIPTLKPHGTPPTSSRLIPTRPAYPTACLPPHGTVVVRYAPTPPHSRFVFQLLSSAAISARRSASTGAASGSAGSGCCSSSASVCARQRTSSPRWLCSETAVWPVCRGGEWDERAAQWASGDVGRGGVRLGVRGRGLVWEGGLLGGGRSMGMVYGGEETGGGRDTRGELGAGGRAGLCGGAGGWCVTHREHRQRVQVGRVGCAVGRPRVGYEQVVGPGAAAAAAAAAN